MIRRSFFGYLAGLFASTSGVIQKPEWKAPNVGDVIQIGNLYPPGLKAKICNFKLSGDKKTFQANITFEVIDPQLFDSCSARSMSEQFRKTKLVPPLANPCE